MSIQSISLPATPAYTGASPTPAAAPAAAPAVTPVAAPAAPVAAPVAAAPAAPDATAATVAVASTGLASPAASVNAPPQTASGSEPSKEQVHAAIEKIKHALPPNATNLAFSIDKDSHKTVVKVIDSQTNQTIKQFPSKEVLALAKRIGEFQESLGVLLRGQA